MKSINSALAAMFLVGALGLGSAASAADGFILKVSATPGSYCRMVFPAIREDTLFTDKPVLKDASTNDVIHISGSCDHDPLGKEEVRRQREDYLARFGGNVSH